MSHITEAVEVMNEAGRVIKKLQEDKAELLEALKLVLLETGTECYCERTPEEEYHCGRCKSKAAIAKAEGVRS